MKACKQKIGAFKSSKKSLLSYRPKTHCDYTQRLIPLKKWAKTHNYSIWQTKNLIKKKMLMAKKYKDKWYVQTLPPFKDLFPSENEIN